MSQNYDYDDEINISLLNKFYIEAMKVEDKRISEFIKEHEGDIKFNKEKIRAEIINQCFNNIIDLKNINKNYRLVNILMEKGSINKNLFDKEKLKKIFEIFKKNYIEQKNKEKEILNKIGNSNENNSPTKINIKNNNIINIKLSKRFLAKTFYLYTDKKDLIKFIIEEILNKDNMEDKSIIIKEFIGNKNNFEIEEFITKEEVQFYIYIFLEINYLEKKIEYINKDNKFLIQKINQDINNISYFKDFFNIFFIQKNTEIINDLCDIIYQIYNINNNIKDLITKCKEKFEYTLKENINIIYLLKYIIIQSEKDYIINIKPHFSLIKKSIIKINIEEKKDEINNLFFYGNSTINQIYQYLSNKNKNNNKVYYICNNINENEENKYLNEFDKKIFKINKKEIEKNLISLIKEEKLTEKFENILKDWFNYFSKGKNKMTKSDLAECMNKLTGKNKYNFNSCKVLFFLKKNSDNLEFIILDKFINYYYICITKGNKENVWMNIQNMNLRYDLSKIPQIKENKLLPRYYLSNEIEEEKNFYLMNIFKEKYKKSLNKDLYDFLFFLSTDETIYDYILKNFNSDENMKFTKRQEEYLYNLYIINIIESIFEDVELNNNNKLKEINICEEEYYLYKKENNIELKIKFFIEFIKNNYTDFILFTINNLEKINSLEKEKTEYIFIKLCKKSIQLIYRIYNYYHNLTLDSKKDDYILGKNSLKEFIEENNLIKEINEQDNYKNIFEQLMKFLEIINNNNNKEEIHELINESFYLFICLLFLNKEIFDAYKNNPEKNLLLNKILISALTSDKLNYVSNIIIIFNNANLYREEILLYLIDIFFEILNIKNNIETKILKLLSIKINKFLINIIKDNTKVEIKKKIKEKVYQIFYKSLNDEIINNISVDFIQTFSKLLEEQKVFRDELIEEKYNEKSLYDLIYEKINKKEEDKLIKEYEKYDNLKKFLKFDSDNDKYIEFDIIKKKIDEIFVNNNNPEIKNININNNEPNKILFDTLQKYLNSYISNNTTNNQEIIKQIISSLKNLLNKESSEFNNINRNNLPDEIKKRIKKTTPYRGIKNLAALCYIGSIMQQFFFISKFRYIILSINDNRPIDSSYDLTDDDNILHQTQKLFTNMLFSSFGDIIPKNFIFSLKFFGERINPRQMLDSSEFYLNYCDMIQTSIENTKYKNLMEDIFYGKTKEKKICGGCNNETYKEDEFKNISLEVKDMKDIYESLDKYMSEEIIDDYKCDKCNNKVKLKKYTYISSLPNILVIHLKRIIFNNKGEQDKITSKFDFPFDNLNLKKYYSFSEKNKNLDEDYFIYNLKGINIHKGTAEGGHYISLIKTENDKWYLFDDSSVSEYDINKFEEEFNKKEKNSSAYILFYESKKEKKMITPFDKLINKEYINDVFNENKIYEELYGSKIIDINNNLVKLLLDIINNDQFKLNCDNLTLNKLRDMYNIFIDIIINYYSNENYRKNPEEKDIKSIINIINKIFISTISKDNILLDSDRDIILKLIKEKLFSDKNIRLIFTKEEIKPLSEKLYEIIHLLIEENKEDNDIFSKTEFHELLNLIIDHEKIISKYLYKILYEIIIYYPDAELQDIDANSFLDLYYKTKEEYNKESLKEIYNIFNYYIKEKNIIEKFENISKVLSEELNNSFFKILFDGESNDTLIKTIYLIQKDNKKISDLFNTDLIQQLYTYCLKNKEKQIKLIKIIFSILNIKDKYIEDRIKILLGFPNLIMKSSNNNNNILKIFGINLLNNDINNELFEYSNYNLIKKDRCVLSYLFPSLYNLNNENKLEKNDINDLIYELINISLGLNNHEGNYFLFKTLYLMQSRSIKYDNLYQEMKFILEKENNNNKYDLDKIKQAEKDVINLVQYEVEKMEAQLGNKKNFEKIKPKLPEIYIKWEKILNEEFNRQYIGCLSNIFPFEIGKIEISEKLNSKKFSIYKFNFYTTYFTKEELTKLSNSNKPFIYDNIKREKPNIISSTPTGDDYITNFSILNEKKDIKELIIYIIEKLKEHKKVIIENKEIINKYEIKSTLNKYYILNNDKKSIIKAKISSEEMEKEETLNFYLPQYIYNSIKDNEVINFLNVYMIKKEYKFFANNDLGINLKCANYDKYLKEMFE